MRMIRILDAPAEEIEFFGIADAHGVESFFPITAMKERGLVMSLRAASNRQRHAILFKAKFLRSEDVEKVKEDLKNGKYKLALQKIKRFAVEIGIERGFENSWNLIPDDRLDPWNPNSMDKET